ncbi:MAG: elongation factor P [Candidatus Pacebacteria bacterium]|nr:elongation factor P [Candidatus Paceibacterota bacterium]
MISTSDFEKGIVIKIESDPWQIVDYQFVNPGKGSAFYRTTIKNLKNGKTLEKTFKSGDRFEEIELNYKKAVYLYSDKKNAVFLEKNKNQRLSLPLENCKNKIKYLKEKSEIDLVYSDDELLDINIPKKVTLKVKEAPPAVKGNTATGATKTIILETGLEVNTPIFVKEGDEIIVNTETGEYVSRG